MTKAKTITLRSVQSSQVSSKGGWITITVGTTLGSMVGIKLTPELASTFIAGLTDACRKANKIRDMSGGTPEDGLDIWKIDRAIVESIPPSTLYLHLDSAGVRHVFQLTTAEGATLANDLGALQRSRQKSTSPSSESAIPESETLPSVLELPLVTEPIQTASMSDFPDGLLLEARLDTQRPDGTFGRVRIPMFAQTARNVVGALQERLKRIGEDEPPPRKLPS